MRMDKRFSASDSFAPLTLDPTGHFVPRPPLLACAHHGFPPLANPGSVPVYIALFYDGNGNLSVSVNRVMCDCLYVCTDLSQSQLETVIPRDTAAHVMIVSGKHRAQVCQFPPWF